MEADCFSVSNEHDAGGSNFFILVNMVSRGVLERHVGCCKHLPGVLNTDIYKSVEDNRVLENNFYSTNV